MKRHPLANYLGVTGNLASALLLSQIDYWFSPSKLGGGLRVKHQRKGRLWLVKSREGFSQETGLSIRQVELALVRLKELGLIYAFHLSK